LSESPEVGVEGSNEMSNGVAMMKRCKMQKEGELYPLEKPVGERSEEV
jgi:hypothetical protein